MQKGTVGLISLTLGALLMLSVGLWGVWACVIQPVTSAWQTQHWIATSAVLDDVRLQGTGGTWQPPTREGKIDPAARIAQMPYGQLNLEVRYHYVVDGQAYEGTHFGLHQTLTDGDRIRQAAAFMYRRQVVTAWVNPGQPNQAVLDRQLHWEILLFGVPAAAMALLAAVIAWACVFTLLRTPDPRHKNRKNTWFHI